MKTNLKFPGALSAWNSAMKKPYSTQSLRAARKPPTPQCRLATASRNKTVSAATTWATKAERKPHAHGKCFRHGHHHRPQISRVTFATHKQKIPKRRCREILPTTKPQSTPSQRT